MLLRIGRRVAAFSAVAILAVACTQSAADEPSPDTAAMVERKTTGPDYRAALRLSVKQTAYFEALAGAFVIELQRADWWNAATAAWWAAQPRPSSTSSSSYPSGGGSGYDGGCYASDIPDYIIDRESGGDPGVWNGGGSGAWGCFQFMPGTWCDDLGPHGSASVEAQVECANRVWAGGAGASNWSQTL